MFRIRRRQVDALRVACLQSFVAEQADRLSFEAAAELLAHDITDVRAMVHESIEAAKGYAIVHRDDLERYLDLAATLGPAFDRDGSRPWITETLRDDELDGEDKLDRIAEQLIFGELAMAESGR